MKTLQITNKDIAISNHNFVVLGDSNTLKQRIAHRLSLFLGEFSLEPSLGMDWFTLREFRYNTNEIARAVRSEILKDPEVVSIDSLEIVFIDTPEKEKLYNRPRRSIFINWSVNSIYGSIANA